MRMALVTASVSFVVDHLVKGDGEGRPVAGHHITGRVAHQDNVDACRISDACCSVIIRCQHGNLLAFCLHLNEPMCSNLALVFH